MSWFRFLLLLLIVGWAASCGTTPVPLEKEEVAGRWVGNRDTLNLETNGNFKYLGYGAEGQVLLARGHWRIDSNYFILSSDSSLKDSINAINKAIVDEANKIVTVNVQGKTEHLPQCLLYSTTYLPYRCLVRFNNSKYKIQDDTLLTTLDENDMASVAFRKRSIKKGN
jgi:hypothetical protein